ncbi:MAG TPA: chemotaxis-specific protein-glutamate methyltransferase CheB [Candidatus Limnocylindria bacterium]|nr:chemotaxis-specific protein-glutamate methyltransferase CheB [Candidatus Limnocylindria bacterium]
MKRIRVLVAEDSATAREALLALFSRDADIEVIGVANDGGEAVALTKRLRPDIVTMDIHMPVLDGYEATRRIMAEAPTPILVVSSSVSAIDAQASLNALRAGALGLCEKPSLGNSPAAAEEQARFLETVRALSDVKVVRRTRVAPREPRIVGDRREERAEIIAIAASTGGPAALAQLVAALPADLTAPVLAVQHNTRGFMPALAGWLNSTGNLRVRIATRGDRPEPGVLYLAPDDHHLGIDGRRHIALDARPPIEGFRPSATFLFESVGRAYGPGALAVILTGMGSDGVDGLRRLRETGGRVLAQDEASSVVFGMPRAAIAAGVVDEVVALADLPTRICEAAAWSG